MLLTVSKEVVDLGVRGAYFTLTGMKIPAESRVVDALVEVAVASVLDNWTEARIEEDDILNGFDALHSRVGRAGKKNVASPTNLLRTILRSGALPRVNAAVDLYNVVSLETRLALGAHDAEAIDGTVALRLSRGDEAFVPLGRANARRIGAGEYIYVDEANDVLCRMETRQVEKTKVQLGTSSCFYIVQGNARTSREQIDRAVDRLIGLTQEVCGGVAGDLVRVS